MSNLLITFIIFNVLNVIIQTIKSIATIKCGKGIAAIVNAIAYGLYTYVIVLTVCELPLWEKAFIVGLANLIGVYTVKYFEEKTKQDKLWKIEATIKNEYIEAIVKELEVWKAEYSMIDMNGGHMLINIYSPTQKDSAFFKSVLNKFHVKYFVTESKIL